MLPVIDTGGILAEIIRSWPDNTELIAEIQEAVGGKDFYHFLVEDLNPGLIQMMAVIKMIVIR